jgi:hypothetical protein
VTTTAKTCHTCNRELSEGEEAWVSHWKVPVDHFSSAYRMETRYTCDDCEANE